MKKYDVALFGASTDTISKNQQFAEKLELDYPLLSDTGGKVAAAYGILNGLRAKRVAIVIGKDGTIAHIIDPVQVRQHGQQLLDVLQQRKRLWAPWLSLVASVGGGVSGV